MTDETVNLTTDDLGLIWEFSSVKLCSLATAPGSDDNWIERAGGSLPNYVCQIAKGIMRSGKSKDAAIAIAISRIKKWAAGGDDVNADTRAKAAVALAQWTALKAKNKSKQLVRASAPNGEDFIILSSVDSYSLDQVREAWDKDRTISRNIVSQSHGYEVAESTVPYGYVREVYSDFIVVSFDGPKNSFYRIPYTVEDDTVKFGEPSPVRLMWEDEANDWRVAARS